MLTVKALRCVELRDVAVGSAERQDPYVTLTLEENQKLHTKTDVCYAGGVNPQWLTGNWMRLPVPQSGMTCLVQVWDKHSQDADELIATGRIPLGRYDEDGTEEEPMSIDLYWQGKQYAGKFHCVVTYEPPGGSVPAHQVESASRTKQAPQRENWVPWLRIQMRHRSGKVKDFLLSRTTKTYTQGREYVQQGIPVVRSHLQSQYDTFRSRQPLEQSVYIAAAILLVILPWPRAVVAYLFNSVFTASNYTFSTMYDWTLGAMQAFTSSMYGLGAMIGSFSWYITSFALRWGMVLGLYLALPVATVLFMPRLLGLATSRIASAVLGGHLVSFGTITFVPWMTDLRRLKFRIIVVDFLFGNPRDKGFTPRCLSFNRFEMVGSLAWSDIWQTLMLRKEQCPLSDVDDYERLATLRVDHMEIDGMAINLEVNDKNRVNVLDIVSEYDRAQVMRELSRKEINPKTFRFPNCLEVQVMGARNLRAMDSNGLSDPYYTVRVRRQKIDSPTVVKTLNPAFPPRIEQFFVNDPSAVLVVELWDQDVGRSSDLVGKWNTTLKWLLMDPNNMKLCERESLTEEDCRQGWMGFWAPLVDENFRQEGLCGDVHLKMRWVYNPALPDIRPGDRLETMTPLQQIRVGPMEIRERLGDLHRIIDIIKHLPILLDFEGPFVINDTLISLHDILYGRQSDRDNIVKKILVQTREETEKEQIKATQVYPRSVGIRETPAAVDRTQVQPTNQPMVTSGEQNVEQKDVDVIEQVVVQNVDPTTDKLPKGLEVEITNTKGTGEFGVTRDPGEALERPPTMKNPSSDQQRKLDKMEEEHRRALDTESRAIDRTMTTTTETSSVRTEPLSDTHQTLKDTLAKDIAKGDRLNAVYPEKLISSAPAGGAGYVRGDIAELRKEIGPTRKTEDRVYLGDEDDDDAAEERNADRFSDDDREFDQDGREFIKIRPIIWRKQFLARHGDPGINAWKFIQRLIRGIIPKIASDSRLRRAVEGTAFKSIFAGDLDPGSLVTGATPEARSEGLERGVGRKAVDKVKGAAHAVADQVRLMEKKVFHHTQDAELRTDPGYTSSTTNKAYDRTFPERTTDDTSSTNVAYERASEREEGVDYENIKTTRPVHGQDADFNRSDLVIAGGLEAVWQGRHRITSLFRRWKPWHVEIKGDTIFYHKTSSSGLSSSLSSDSTWYTLDLTWLSDIYMTDSSRIHNNELVMRFVQDDSTLHLRLPRGITTPTLEDWLGAFRNVQNIQQRRRRLGTNHSEGEASTPRQYNTTPQHSTGPWPGEDLKPQPRQRGSSLTINMPMRTETTATQTPTKSETIPLQSPVKTETVPLQTSVKTELAPLPPPAAVMQQPMSNLEQMPALNKANAISSVEVNKPHQMGSNVETSTIDPAMQQRNVIQS